MRYPRVLAYNDDILKGRQMILLGNRGPSFKFPFVVTSRRIHEDQHLMDRCLGYKNIKPILDSKEKFIEMSDTRVDRIFCSDLHAQMVDVWEEAVRKLGNKSTPVSADLLCDIEAIIGKLHRRVMQQELT